MSSPSWPTNWLPLTDSLPCLQHPADPGEMVDAGLVTGLDVVDLGLIGVVGGVWVVGGVGVVDDGFARVWNWSDWWVTFHNSSPITEHSNIVPMKTRGMDQRWGRILKRSKPRVIKLG